jgi:antitoxin VapB
MEQDMRAAELKEWRTKLGLTQEEAGRRLGKTRMTIQNWENGATPISFSVELHCRHVEEEEMRRPEYGPVVLLCAGGLGVAGPYFRREFPNNEAAINNALEIWDKLQPGHPMINDKADGTVTVWSESKLRGEIDKRLAAKHTHPEKVGMAERLMEIGRHFSSLPVLDDRTDDEILGYDEFGLPH